jgi:flagellar hook-associated protein 3 FlgL
MIYNLINDVYPRGIYMRITNSMMVSGMMRNLNNNLNRMDKIQNQMATGKKILKPSDDPVGMAQVLKLTSDITASEQHKKNVDEALSWLETTEMAVTQLKDVMQRVRELTVRGSTGSLADEDKQAIQKEISQLKEQIVTIGNSTFAGRYIFGGYNTMGHPFTVEETPVGDKLKYNGKYLSPGGVVDETISDEDFIDFLTNPNSKELTNEQMVDTLNIEIGIGDLMNVNVNGHELFEKGFGGVFETLTKLDRVLGGKEDYKQGFVDMRFETTPISLDSDDLDNSMGDKKISIQLGQDTFQLKLPNKELTRDSIQEAIDSIEFLKKNGVTVEIDTAGNISFIAQENITVNAELGDALLTNETTKQMIAPLIIGNRLEGTLETSTENHEFILNQGGSSFTLSLPQNKVYDLDSGKGRNELLRDIRDQLEDLGLLDNVQVSFTEDNRLKFQGQYKDASAALFDDLMIENPASGNTVEMLGLVNGQVSEKAVVKSEKLDASSLLGDIDKNMENILAKLSELGAKNNRLELSMNRLDDNILNLKGLISKVQDVDMSEVIMNLKMEEMVYQASLSTGARIIQPTLVDFIR